MSRLTHRQTSLAGSPKKRAKREAERLRKAAEAAQQNASTTETPTGALPSLPAVRPQDRDVKHGEILPPVSDEQVTRTAFKRAMRKKAAEHAERAIAVLALNLESEDEKIRGQAANDILKWTGVDKIEGEIGGEGQQVVILRFGDAGTT